VSSIDSRTLKKNELISRSNNIDDEIAKALCERVPSRGQLTLDQSESVSFFELNGDQFALSRSVPGRIEGSRSGGRQTVSHIIVFDRAQLQGYQNNVVLLLRVVRSMGLLILQTSMPKELPLIDIPHQSFQEPNGFSRSELAKETERIVRAIDIHKRVVILGLLDPLSFLCAFLAELPLEERTQISFATGMNVVDEKPFDLQFFPRAETELDKELASRQLRTISLAAHSMTVY